MRASVAHVLERRLARSSLSCVAAQGLQAAVVLLAARIWIENGEERQSAARLCGTE
jgi:hypothetical protein